MKARTRILGGVAAIGLLCALGVLAMYRHELRQEIQSIAVKMRSAPYSWIAMIGLLVLTSIPPFIGFTFCASLTGFIYGVPRGFPIAITGAFLGAMTCFRLIRQYKITRFIQLSSSKQEKYLAIQEAIEQGGLGIMLLIRLSPIPWPITNMMLSALPKVTLRQFTITALISSFKLCLEVWVGSQLADIANPDLPDSAHRVAVMTMMASVVILIAVAYWLYRLTMQRVQGIRTSSPSGRSLDDEERSVATLALPTQKAD
ncbi:hypothetical protein DM01DRAFT_1334001 [Hesseltinella vesiculosa]|uniref:Golgi apparatus membrane protein TVP38 n=1 Tax=Hesseltinella vesiculosa TaxID=101127 RepID=A0A1X2GME0_9FUNG|nr:hypothetical protein DM01DRAFT_1334001 [Hesseltinella vesiculosa]